MLSKKGKEKEASSSRSRHPPRGRNAYIKPPQRLEDRPVIRRVAYRYELFLCIYEFVALSICSCFKTNFICRVFAGDVVDVTKNINKIISQCARFHYPSETRLPTIPVCTKFDDYPDDVQKEVKAEFLVSKISFLKLATYCFSF